MTIQVAIEKDSLAPSGVRLTTFILRYPRFIHSELMTHRMFSRNASSSRAIPFKRQLEMIKKDMAMPLLFRENKKGMQAGKALSGWKQKACFAAWRMAGHTAIVFAKVLDRLGSHKQYVNRIIEPFSHITVVLTGTDEAFANFFALRAHPDAQPEIRALAVEMHKQYLKHQPSEVPFGWWHLPFVQVPVGKPEDIDWRPYIKMSVARCARTSYLNHDGTNPDPEKDFALYDRLLGSEPLHASPSEHQAQALESKETRSGNFHGWGQFRKYLPNEYITTLQKGDIRE